MKPEPGYDADGHVRDVYAHFGLAIYLSQVLEHGIVNAMVALRLPNRDKVVRNDIDLLMEGQFEQTLGRIMRNLRQETTLPPGLEQLLNDALRKRNWLSHGYFRNRAVEFTTPEGREKMISELRGAQVVLENAEAALAAVIRPLEERAGITEEMVRNAAAQLLERNPA